MLVLVAIAALLSAGCYLAGQKDGAFFLAALALFVLAGEHLGVKW